jgi:hypothetical protein
MVPTEHPATRARLPPASAVPSLTSSASCLSPSPRHDRRVSRLVACLRPAGLARCWPALARRESGAAQRPPRRCPGGACPTGLGHQRLGMASTPQGLRAHGAPPASHPSALSPLNMEAPPRVPEGCNRPMTTVPDVCSPRASGLRLRPAARPAWSPPALTSRWRGGAAEGNSRGDTGARRGDAGGWARVKSGFIFPILPSTHEDTPLLPLLISTTPKWPKSGDKIAFIFPLHRGALAQHTMGRQGNDACPGAAAFDMPDRTP